jgi:hypothetical protein
MNKLTKEEIQKWVDERFGVLNTFNIQILEDFQDRLFNQVPLYDIKPFGDLSPLDSIILDIQRRGKKT